MAKVSAEISRVERLAASPQVVHDFLMDFLQVRDIQKGLDRFEPISEKEGRWLFHDRVTAGVRIKVDYTVRMSSNGSDSVSWTTIAGTVDDEATINMRALDDGQCEMRYWQKMTVDVPLPRLLVRVGAPAVKLLTRRELNGFVDRLVARFR